MTNYQLSLSIGIPSFLILLSWMQTNVRLSDLKGEIFRRFESFEKRFDKLDVRLDKGSRALKGRIASRQG